jgi:AraC-like DNA-binding protein
VAASAWSPLIVPARGSGAVVELSTSQVRPYERVDFWREMVCRLFAEVELSSRLGADFWGEMAGRPWGEMRITDVRAKAQSVQRRLREAKTEDQDCYFAVLLLAGSEFVEQDGHETLLRPGDMTVYDATRPHRLQFSSDFRKLILNIPRHLLRERVAGLERFTALRIPARDGVPAVASNFLKSFADNAANLSAGETTALADQALDLLALAIASVRPVEACFSRSRSLSLCRVKDFVEQHLADPELDAEHIARGVGLSPRYINKLFEDEGSSLMRYVWTRRLARCRQDMLEPAHTGHRLSEIALRWGFNDLSHFSRAFRQQFGLAPREFRQVNAP